METKYSIARLLSRMEKNWPEARTTETEIALGLIRLNDLSEEGAKQALVPFNLTIAGFEVLSTLRSLPSPQQLTPTELYKSILITSGGMTKVLKHLETKGLIERADNEQDGRSKFVKLTKAGSHIAEEAMAAIAKSDQRLFGQSLNKEELNNLRDILLNALTKLEND